MDSSFNRKRPADSDDNTDLSNKKQFIDASEETGNIASTNETENGQDPTIHDQTKTGQEEPASTDTPTESAPEFETVIPYERLVILNMEVTCDENVTNPAAVQVTKEHAEVIQLSFVIVKSSTLEILKEQTILVKPERTPITPFCTQINGITPDMVDSAGSLKEAIETLDKTIRTEILDNNMEFCFVTHGGWALRIQLSREARDKQLELPSYLSQPCMFDLKQELQRWQVHHPQVNVHSNVIRELCHAFNIPLVPKKSNQDKNDDGATTKGSCNDNNIDIPATITSIMRYLTKPKHNDVFVHPIDTSADLQQFKKEESKVVHLAGLPCEVTQGELEAWFSSSGLRPATMWMMQATDLTKPNLSGFVLFSFHDDAVRALLLNGRCLSDRVIEVSPSSERVVGAARSMLAPFPVQSKPRDVRPGDWKCPNCSFHNFASRHHCFKCNAENPTNSGSVPGAGAGNGAHSTTTPGFSHGAGNSNSAPPSATTTTTTTTSAQPYSYSPSAPGHHPHPPPPSFHQGDWVCPNSNCKFHNYASRSQCMKCNTYRPSGPGAGGAPPPPPPPSGYSPHNHHYAPRPHHTPNFRPGDWYCPNPPCGFQNFASRMTCYRCHTPNPNPGPQQNYGGTGGPNAASNAGGGAHGSYGYDNGPGGAPYGGGNTHGSNYGNLPPGNTMAPGTGGHGFRAGDWYCPSCHSHNFASRFQCLKCHTAKPYNPSQPTPPPYAGGFRGPPPMKSGDWVCRNSGCGFHNFAKRTYCGKCHAPNPEPSSTYGTSEY